MELRARMRTAFAALGQGWTRPPRHAAIGIVVVGALVGAVGISSDAGEAVSATVMSLVAPGSTAGALDATGDIAFVTPFGLPPSRDFNGRPDIYVAVGANKTLMSATGTQPPPAPPASDPGITDLTSVVDEPSISPDGHWVVFTSTSLAYAPQAHGERNVYLKDTSSGNLATLVSFPYNAVGVRADSVRPVVDNAGHVAFQSRGTDLAPLSAGVGNLQIYVSGIAGAGPLTVVSAGNGGTTPGNGDSQNPSISLTGLVTFDSYATDLVAAPVTSQQVYVRDTGTNTTTLLSIDSTNAPGNGASFEPEISADGGFVAFTSSVDLASPGIDLNNQADVYRVRIPPAQPPTLVSVNPAGQAGNAGSSAPAISGDGRYVVFKSAATDLMPVPASAGITQIYTSDMLLGTMARASEWDDGSSGFGGRATTRGQWAVQGNASSTEPTISMDGATVGFTTSSSNLPGNQPGVIVRPNEPLPAPPNGTSVIQDAPGQVTVSWQANADPNLYGYEVIVVPPSGPAPAPVFVDASQTATTLPGLANAVDYTFRVASVSAVGVGPLSPAISLADPAGLGQVPTAPMNLAAARPVPDAGGGVLAVSWSPPADNGGRPVTSYTVTITPAPIVGPPVRTVNAPATTLSVTGLANGTAYDITVAATNVLGTGPDSAPVNATPATVPGVPVITLPADASGNTSVHLTWTAPADGGTAITGYRIIPIANGVPQPAAPIVAGAQLETMITGLTNGVPYTFTIAAGNAVGFGPASPPTALPVIPAGPPGPPQNVQLTQGPTPLDPSAIVSWAAPPPGNQGGRTIVGYKVQTVPPTSAPDGGTFHIADPTSPGTATIPGLSPGIQYRFIVYADYDPNFPGGDPTLWIDGQPSQPTAVAFYIAPSTAPLNVRLNNAAGQSANFAWDPPADLGGNVTPTYEITASAPGQPAVTATSITTNASLSNLAYGVPYTVQVRTTDAGGSPWSAPLTYTPLNKPTKPTGLTVTDRGGGNAGLTWTDGNNGGWAVTRYQVTALPSTGSPTTAIVGTSPAIMSGLSLGVPYRFQVAALYDVDDKLGDQSDQSAPISFADPPGTPDNFRVTSVRGTRVTFAWTVPPDNGLPILAYDMDATTDSGEIQWAGMTNSGYLDLPMNVPFDVKVRARNARGASEWSTPIVAVASPKPAAPTALVAEAADGQVTLSWTAPPSGSAPITAYHITARSGSRTLDVPDTASTTATITGLANGIEWTFTVAAINARGSSDPSAPVHATPLGVPSSRWSGADRYATVAAISRATFNPGVPAAFVATGENWPDVVAAGPAAAALGGPVLLVQHNAIPPVVADELARLAPGRIIVLGDSGTVSDDIAGELKGFTPTGQVTRYQGADRYATAAAVSAAVFQPGVPVVYVATGTTFPDAIVAGLAAAMGRGPVLLVQPNSLPAVTAQELARLHPQKVVVLGTADAVAPAVLNAVGSAAGVAPVRVGGVDRYDTAARLSKQLFPGHVGTVYVATGDNFPDAAGAVAAAFVNRAPILLVPSSGEVPDGVLAEVRRLAPTKFVVLGDDPPVPESMVTDMRQAANAPS